MQLNKLDRDEQTNIAARSAALKVLDSYTVKSTSTVNYTSGGSLLVLADKSLTKSVIELICERLEKNKLLIVFIPGNRSGQSIYSMPEDS